MSIEQQLFKGELARQASPDPEHDAEIESKWTHDPDYMRLISFDPIRPLSPPQISKKYEAIEKDGEKQFYFAVRAIRSYEKAGFVLEGRVRSLAYFDGQRYDEVFMGILREEWEARTG